MRIYKISNDKKETKYQMFKDYLTEHFYTWDKLPKSLNNEKIWNRFLSEYPQYYHQYNKNSNDPELKKKAIEFWRKIIIRNPDFLYYCPFEELKNDLSLKQEIRDFWINEIEDAPYIWHRAPSYVKRDSLIWMEILKRRPSYKHFLPKEVSILDYVFRGQQ